MSVFESADMVRSEVARLFVVAESHNPLFTGAEIEFLERQMRTRNADNQKSVIELIGAAVHQKSNLCLELQELKDTPVTRQLCDLLARTAPEMFYDYRKEERKCLAYYILAKAFRLWPKAYEKDIGEHLESVALYGRRGTKFAATAAHSAYYGDSRSKGSFADLLVQNGFFHICTIDNDVPTCFISEVVQLMTPASQSVLFQSQVLKDFIKSLNRAQNRHGPEITGLLLQRLGSVMGGAVNRPCYEVLCLLGIYNYSAAACALFQPYAKRLFAQQAATLCFGLEDLGLPALLTLGIIDELLPNEERMWFKWELATKVKHFHDKR